MDDDRPCFDYDCMWIITPCRRFFFDVHFKKYLLRTWVGFTKQTKHFNKNQYPPFLANFDSQIYKKIFLLFGQTFLFRCTYLGFFNPTISTFWITRTNAEPNIHISLIWEILSWEAAKKNILMAVPLEGGGGERAGKKEEKKKKIGDFFF